MPAAFDPSNLTGIATHLDSNADDLRRRASRVSAGAAATRWESNAADSFRRDVGDLARDLNRCAGQVSHAADSLRRHAAAVGRVEAELSAALRITEQIITAPVRAADELFHAVTAFF